MSLSVWHVLVVLIVVLILFGAGKLPRVMGDFAKGIKNFKAGLADDDKPSETQAPANITQQSAANGDTARATEKVVSSAKS